MIATPTPIETPLELEPLGEPLDPPDVESAGALASLGRTALPSARANASVSAVVESVNRPPATIVTGPIVASEMVFTRLIATAAATLTPPADVFVLGVCSASPSPVPPLSVDMPFANERSPPTCCETPSPALPPPLGSAGAAALDASCGAPAAEAFAVADVSEVPCAASVTAPPAFRFRQSVASVRWFAIVSARDTPIAAVLAFASPSAVVFADAV